MILIAVHDGERLRWAHSTAWMSRMRVLPGGVRAIRLQTAYDPIAAWIGRVHSEATLDRPQLPWIRPNRNVVEIQGSWDRGSSAVR